MSMTIDEATPALEVLYQPGLDDYDGGGGDVWLRIPSDELLDRDIEIPINAFLRICRYVLVNGDLVKNDPRVAFIAWVKRLDEVDGFNEGSTRLSIPGFEKSEQYLLKKQWARRIRESFHNHREDWHSDSLFVDEGLLGSFRATYVAEQKKWVLTSETVDDPDNPIHGHLRDVQALLNGEPDGMGS